MDVAVDVLKTIAAYWIGLVLAVVVLFGIVRVVEFIWWLAKAALRKIRKLSPSA
jgi:hypothetical protein